SCDLILIFDDLDCRDPEQQTEKMRQGISNIPECHNVNTFVGFAAPEIEAWLITDWDNSVANHPDFRSRHQRMRHWLSTERKIPFNAPESFSNYDAQRDCCREKLSDALIESTQFAEDRVANLPIFSKSYHTPNLLLMVEGEVIQKKCPLFRQLYHYLNNLFENY
ncbi:MAG: hypothetical protein ACLFQP_12000, partial [Halothece sp.]